MEHGCLPRLAGAESLQACEDVTPISNVTFNCDFFAGEHKQIYNRDKMCCAVTSDNHCRNCGIDGCNYALVCVYWNADLCRSTHS